jgi:hypothetical protein
MLEPRPASAGPSAEAHLPMVARWMLSSSSLAYRASFTSRRLGACAGEDASKKHDAGLGAPEEPAMATSLRPSWSATPNPTPAPSILSSARCATRRTLAWKRRTCRWARSRAPSCGCSSSSRALAGLPFETRTENHTGFWQLSRRPGRGARSRARLLRTFPSALRGREKRVLEVGTFTGYSALMMACGLSEDGQLITCDIDPEAVAVARRFFDQSPTAAKSRSAWGRRSTPSPASPAPSTWPSSTPTRSAIPSTWRPSSPSYARAVSWRPTTLSGAAGGSRLGTRMTGPFTPSTSAAPAMSASRPSCSPSATD